MKNYYFKIQFGYGKDEYLTITQDELHKALALFVTGGRGLFQNGAVRGQDIIRIVPDWHTDQGWNKNHEMTPFDWETIAPFQERYKLIYGKAKEYATFLLENNRTDLLSKPFPKVVKELPLENKELDKNIKVLADNFRL